MSDVWVFEDAWAETAPGDDLLDDYRQSDRFRADDTYRPDTVVYLGDAELVDREDAQDIADPDAFDDAMRRVDGYRDAERADRVDITGGSVPAVKMGGGMLWGIDADDDLAAYDFVLVDTENDDGTHFMRETIVLDHGQGGAELYGDARHLGRYDPSQLAGIMDYERDTADLDAPAGNRYVTDKVVRGLAEGPFTVHPAIRDALDMDIDESGGMAVHTVHPYRDRIPFIAEPGKGDIHAGVAEDGEDPADMLASDGVEETVPAVRDGDRVVAGHPAFGHDALDGLAADAVYDQVTAAAADPDSPFAEGDIETRPFPARRVAPRSPVRAVFDMPDGRSVIDVATIGWEPQNSSIEFVSHYVSDADGISSALGAD